MPDIESLRKALRDREDDARVERMWERIKEADDGITRRSSRVPKSGGRTRMTWIAGAASLAAAAAFMLMTRPSPAPLYIEDEIASGSLPAGESVRFSDDSTIALGSQTQLDVLDNSPRELALALRTGRARFEVTPGGPRAWRIDCGDVTVEVVGTVFTIERASDHVRVEVERGSVLVRGKDVPDRVQRLDAGHSLNVESAVDAPLTAVDSTFDVVPTPTADPLEERAVPVVELERTALPVTRSTEELAPVSDRLAEQLAEADSLRNQGRHREAAEALEQIVLESPSDVRSALAAFSLARLRLDRLGEPSLAARDFARAIDLGVPDQLIEGAHAGRAIALQRAGDPAAEEAARRYLELYPDGHYRHVLSRAEE